MSAVWRVGHLVYYEPIEACGVLDLDGVGLGLGGVVRLLHVRPLRLLYELLSGVGQGDQRREDLIQILYGRTLLGLLVDIPRNEAAHPYGRSNLADVGRDGPLADPEQVGYASWIR